MDLSQIDMVVLCGGLGTRLRSTIGEAQKTMALVEDEPFLNKILRYLKHQGFKRVILAVGYQAQDVQNYYRQNTLGLTIEFSKEETPLGTGGAIKNAAAFVKSNHFFAMNGDCFCALDYNEFLALHLTKKNKATLAVSKIEDTRDYGTILLNHDGVIEGFLEKKDVLGGGYVNVGVYCFEKEILGMMPEKKFSVELDFFPLLPAKLQKHFGGYLVDKEFLDIGTPQRYLKAPEIIRKVRGHEDHN